MKKKSELKLIILVLGLIFAISIISNFNLSYEEAQKDSDEGMDTQYEIILKSPKKSGTYTEPFIHIDGNWTDAIGKGWFSGDGSWGNPYVIENVTIDASSSPTGYGIFINNSKNDYFIIINCTISNSVRITGDEAGIRLENSCNGTIIKNNLFNNDEHGIYLYNYCLNNTLINNTITGTDDRAICLDDYCDDNFIVNNTVSGYDDGIYLDYSDNNTVSNNTLRNLDRGIYTRYSEDNYLYYNFLENNLEYGIYLMFQDGATLSCNELINCGLSIYGSLGDIDSYTISTNNTVNGKPIYYYVSENWLDENNFTNAGQVILVDCDYCDISDLNVSDCSRGVHLLHSNHNIVRNITANNNRDSIYSLMSDNNTIYNNTIKNCGNTGIHLDQNNDINRIINNTLTNNYQGVYIYGAGNNNVTDNIITDSSLRAIFIHWSDFNNVFRNNITGDGGGNGIEIYNGGENNTIINNTITNNNRGINIYWNCYYNIIFNNTINNNNRGIQHYNDCQHTKIKNNTISGNSQYGIFLDDNSNNATIFGNLISNNPGTGIEIDDNTCKENIIYLNNFTANGKHAQDDSDFGDNQWDNGTIGNYWDNYIGCGYYTVPGAAGARDTRPIGYKACDGQQTPGDDDDDDDDDDGEDTSVTVLIILLAGIGAGAVIIVVLIKKKSLRK